MNETRFESLSLTALTRYINEKTKRNISRDAYLEFLCEKDYVSDIRTITLLGEINGVSYRWNEEHNSRWPVYDEDIANLLISNIEYIDSIQETITAKKNVASTHKKRDSHHSQPKNYSVNPPSATKSKSNSSRFPCLRLEDFVVIDTETTGMSKNDEVIEIAVVSMDKTCLYYSTFYPSVEVNARASAVNGFTRKKLEGSPKIAEEWKKIVAAIGDKKILCHNTPFDKRLLCQTFAKYGIKYNIERAFYGAYDSRNIAKQWLQTSSYALNDLAHLVGIKREEKHEAVDDCVMTVEFLERLENIVSSNKRFR